MSPFAAKAATDYKLEPAEVVLTPYQLNSSGYAADGPVFSIRTPTGVTLFVTAGSGHSRFSSYALTGASISSSFAVNSTPKLGPGCRYGTTCATGADTTGIERKFDACGAWLLGAITNGSGRVEGLYHAEELCSYPNQTLKSIGYANSTNYGSSFQKIGMILSAKNQPSAAYLPPNAVNFNGVVGQGDQSVIQWQGVPWMYFSGSDDWTTGVARRDASGNWKKWDGITFQSEAIGGRASGLTGVWARSASKTSSAVYIVGSDISTPVSVYLWKSTDGFAFTKQSEPLLTVSDIENPGQPRSERLLYPSIIPPAGDSYLDAWSSSAYLFYGLEDTAYVPSTGKVSSVDGARKLVRRRMDVVSNGLTVDRHLTALTRYYNSSRIDHWATTQVVDAGYVGEWALGYVLNAPQAGTVAIYDCYIPGWDDHMVATDPNCGGWPVVRRLGWIYTSPGAGLAPLSRCFNAGSTNHMVINSTDCSGFTNEGVLGYLVQ